MQTTERTPTRQAIQQCAEWLAYCLSIGWRRGELDFLESLWWKYHDDRGQLQPEQPGDIDEYERCRRIILDLCAGGHRVTWTPNYARDRLRGAAGG